MTSTYTITKYDDDDEEVSDLLTPSSGSKGQVFAADGSQMQQLTAGTDDQILTANSSATLGVDWTTFTGTPSTVFSQTIYGSCDYRNGNQEYFFVWSHASGSSSQNNADFYSSPSTITIIAFSIRPAFDFGWYNTVPTKGDLELSFCTAPLDGPDQPPGDVTSLGVDLTINYTDVTPVANRFKTFSVTGLSHSISTTIKWTLELASADWAGGGGFNGRALITVFVNSTFE